MSLPNQVRKQAELSDQLIAQNTEAGQASTLTDDDPKTGTPEITPTPEPKEGDEFTPLEKPKDSDGDLDAAAWKQRYSVLLGKYNAEVPKLLAKVKSLSEAAPSGNDTEVIMSLRSDITALNAQLKQSQQAEQKTAEELSDRERELRENYGDELVDFQKDSTARLEEQVKSLTEKLSDGEQKQIAGDRKAEMRKRLSPKGVDFDQRNTDKGFLDFIASFGENGQTYSSILPAAFSQNDLDTVERVFLAYEPMTQKTEPAQASTLDRHVQVASSSGSPDGVPQDADWTRDDIKRFYDDVNAGRLTQKEVELYEKSLAAFLSRTSQR